MGNSELLILSAVGGSKGTSLQTDWINEIRGWASQWASLTAVWCRPGFIYGVMDMGEGNEMSRVCVTLKVFHKCALCFKGVEMVF